MKNIHIRNHILNIAIAIGSALLLICAAKIFAESYDIRRQEALEERLKGSDATESEPCSPSEELYPGFYERLSELKAENDDLKGWIYIEGPEISLPVMQSGEEDRDFYLKRDFYGNESKRGTLYMDSACDRIIYGHNMKDGSMFGELDRYTDREYMRRFPQILLYLIGDDGKIISEKYEMVSSFTISEKKFKTEGFLRMIKGETAKDRYDLGEYLEGVNPVPVSEKINDIREIEFLLLVTCEYSTENGRLFVVAKKIS